MPDHSNLKQFLKTLFTDIRFWIILLFIIRLHGITRPPLEFLHNWRQTTVCMVARNFLEVDANPFYPRIDIAGNKTGITGMEFPVFNYLIFLCAKLFSYEHWYGRLINLFVSSIGLWYFFLIIKKYFNPKLAFNACFILIFSIWFTYSRKIMPDTFSMSFILASIYYGSNYFDRDKKGLNLLLYFILASIGILSKLPSGYLLAVFSLFLFQSKYKFSLKLSFAMTSVAILIFPGFWYFNWVPHLVQEYGFWHFFMGKSLMEGFHEILQNVPESLKKFYDVAFKYISFLLFTIGFLKMLLEKNSKLLSVFLISSFGFLFIIFKSGWTFYHHDYYIIPFVPVMALLAAFGLELFKRNWIQWIILIALGLEGFITQKEDFKIKENFAALIHLEKDLNLVSKQSDLILINSGPFPTPMYFAHRKGWVESNDKIQDKAFISAAHSMGLNYIVILKRVLSTEIQLSFPCVLENENYTIYDLHNADNSYF